MLKEREARGVQALRAYVNGDSSEPVLMSEFRGFPKEEVRALLVTHREELESIDAARANILESLLPMKR